MDVEQKTDKSLPFQEAYSTEYFFSGAGRGEVFADIKKALIEKAELVTLIGEEGSGKTMICKMVQEQWETKGAVVFIPSRVESFEDIVRVVAQENNIVYPAAATRTDAKKIFLDLAKSLRKNGTGLLLICDEAETLYLATLERIRKILDDVKAQGGGVQVLLVGRESIEVNMSQLDLCNFKEIVEKKFFLSPLSEHDIWTYLNSRIRESSGTSDKEVFTKEAAIGISALTGGNLRKINRYADKSLQASSDENSFLVLLDHVKDDAEDSRPIVSRNTIFSRIPVAPKYVFIGALFLAVALLAFFFNGENEEEFVGNEQLKKSSPVPVTPLPQQENEEEGVVEQKKQMVPVVVKEMASGPVLETARVKEKKQVEETPVVPASVISKPVVLEQQTPLEISPVEIVETKTFSQDVPELTTQSKILMEQKSIAGDYRIVASKKKQFPVKEEKKSIANTLLFNDPQNQVLERASVAGESWMDGEDDSRFTIQLMSLLSDRAEENVRKIFSQPEYQAVSDKLVVLTQSSEPPVLLVFYGVYPSMSAARNARNNMPIFLRDRHPYPLSVRAAVEKTRTE